MNERSDEALLKSTGLGMVYLMNRAKQLSVRRLEHISSMSIHGKVLAQVVDQNTSVTNSVPVGAAKWAAKCFISNERSSIEAVSIRRPTIAGPYAIRHFLAKNISQIIPSPETPCSREIHLSICTLMKNMVGAKLKTLSKRLQKSRRLTLVKKFRLEGTSLVAKIRKGDNCVN